MSNYWCQAALRYRENHSNLPELHFTKFEILDDREISKQQFLSSQRTLAGSKLHCYGLLAVLALNQ